MKDGQAPGALRPVMGNTGPKAGAGRPLTGRQGNADDMGQTFSEWMEFFTGPGSGKPGEMKPLAELRYRYSVDLVAPISAATAAPT